MNLTFTGMGLLSEDIQNVIDGIREGASKATKEVAIELATEIARDTPVDTGALLATVTAEGSTVTIGGPNAPYAESVEYQEPFIRPNVETLIRSGADIAVETIRREIR